ncbi:MAG: hypothetical protein IIZ06_01035 [Kiritimatiellae bacterium]|nr:hypothetical protein [Kiritimatiellia bacterium]
MPSSTLTRPQLAAFWRAAAMAAKEVGEPLESYRKRVMREELGVEHLAEVSRTTGFDTIMARIWHDAGRDDLAVNCATAATTRLRHVIVAAATQIAPESPLVYLAGVMLQSRTVNMDKSILAACLSTDSGWLDFTIPQLRRILAMLQTHLRRRQ